MKVQNKELKKAYKLIRTGKYPQAIRFLEPKVPLFLEDEHFYSLLGISCLHTGDLGGSEFYFKRSLQVNKENIDSRLYLATVYLKKKDQANAARLWLNVLDMDPSNKTARKGLDRLKKIKSPAELDAYINSGKFFKLTPPLKGLHPRIALMLEGLLILVLAIAAGILLYPHVKPVKNMREQAVSLSLENYLGPLVDVEGTHTYMFSGEEIRELFDSAVDDFHDYDDNALQMKINKIQMSNASPELKSKISILENMIVQPNIMTLKTNFTYRDVAKDPLLYKSCYVLWSGRITNVDIGEDRILLDFLVGYEEEKLLEGIVSVEIPFETSINESIPMEILGQVRYLNGKIQITAVSVRSIIK